MTPLWTILIPTIGRRRDQFKKLAAELLCQAEEWRGFVTVLALYNNGERPLAHVRQALVEGAGADYISFVDDDDWVPDFYVQRVVAAIREPVAPGKKGWARWPDYVGWRMQHYGDGHPSKPTYHSLEYGGWYEDDRGYYRDVSHLNPIRRDLVLKVDFRAGNPPEDVSWADAIRGLVKTEVRIPDQYTMYHYYSSGDSTWRPGSVKPDGGVRPRVQHPLFAWHPESSA